MESKINYRGTRYTPGWFNDLFNCVILVLALFFGYNEFAHSFGWIIITDMPRLFYGVLWLYISWHQFRLVRNEWSR